MAVAKRLEREKPQENRTTEGPRARVRASGRTKHHSRLAQFT